jgi:hypothetical protein
MRWSLEYGVVRQSVLTFTFVISKFLRKAGFGARIRVPSFQSLRPIILENNRATTSRKTYT